MITVRYLFGVAFFVRLNVHKSFQIIATNCGFDEKLICGILCIQSLLHQAYNNLSLSARLENSYSVRQLQKKLIFNQPYTVRATIWDQLQRAESFVAQCHFGPQRLTYQSLKLCCSPCICLPAVLQWWLRRSHRRPQMMLCGAVFDNFQRFESLQPHLFPLRKDLRTMGRELKEKT